MLVLEVTYQPCPDWHRFLFDFLMQSHGQSYCFLSLRSPLPTIIYTCYDRQQYSLRCGCVYLWTTIIPLICVHFIPGLKFLRIYNLFRTKLKSLIQSAPKLWSSLKKSSMYIMMKTLVLQLAWFRVLLHLRVALIIYKIPKQTSQKLYCCLS